MTLESKDRKLTKDDLEIAQTFLANKLDRMLYIDSDPRNDAKLAMDILYEADRVDKNVAASKQSRNAYRYDRRLQILRKRIAEVRQDRCFNSDLQEKVVQRFYKGLQGKKLTPDDIDRLKDIIESESDPRLGDNNERAKIDMVYFDQPTQSDQLLREFFGYNNVRQPLLICGFAFGRTLEQARSSIPERIAEGYTFHFLVFNPFSSNKNIGAYTDFIAYHSRRDADFVIDNCELSFKYLIQTMYRIKAKYNKINSERQKSNKNNKGLKHKSLNGGKGFLGKKFQVTLYEYPLLFYGLFSNLPEDKNINNELDNKYHFVMHDINECERSAHPLHFYRERAFQKHPVEYYKESLMRQWNRAAIFDKNFSDSYTNNARYSRQKLEESARKGIEEVVEACNLNDGESIFDYFEWQHETKT